MSISSAILAPATRARATPPSTRRGIGRLAILAVLSLASPVAGMTYAGLTYTRPIQWLTGIVAALAVAISSVVAYTSPSTPGPGLFSHHQFLMAAAISLNIMFSVAAGLVLTQLRQPDPQSGRRILLENGVIGAMAALLVACAIYPARAYQVQLQHDSMASYVATAKLQVANGLLNGMQPGTATTAKRRLAYLAYHRDMQQKPPAPLLTDEKLAAWEQDQQAECANADTAGDSICTAEDLSSGAAAPRHTRLQALLGTLNPRQVFGPRATYKQPSTAPDRSRQPTD